MSSLRVIEVTERTGGANAERTGAPQRPRGPQDVSEQVAGLCWSINRSVTPGIKDLLGAGVTTHVCDLLVVWAGSGTPSYTPNGISDSKGNTWQQDWNAQSSDWSYRSPCVISCVLTTALVAGTAPGHSQSARATVTIAATDVPNAMVDFWRCDVVGETKVPYGYGTLTILAQ